MYITCVFIYETSGRGAGPTAETVRQGSLSETREVSLERVRCGYFVAAHAEGKGVKGPALAP